MGAKKVALFVDVDSLHQQLRSLHHRSFDPAPLMETARAEGEVVSAVAVADWADLPPELATACEQAGLSRVQVERSPRSRETGGRRRDVVRDGVDVELLAQMVEALFTDDRPEVGFLLLGSCEDAAARGVGLVRARFQKDVVVLGVEGGVGPALEAAATRVVLLPLPAVAPQDPELLARLVPLLEALERKKRYLNFKYIRETIVRRLELPERSFDAAERLLSEAIACGVLLKLKVEDKYNPGQLFTAYALDRQSEWFQRWGSGEPAPIHPEPGEGEAAGGPAPGDDEAASAAATQGEAPAAPAAGVAAQADGSGPAGPRVAAPTFGARAPAQDGRGERRGRAEPEPREQREPAAAQADGARGGGRRRPEPPPSAADDEDEDGPEEGRGGDPRDGRRGRRRQRRRSGQGGQGGREGAGPAEPSIPLSAGGTGGRRSGRNPQLDRVGRAYEAPSRFIQDEGQRPSLEDEDIDEDRILRARGD